MSALLERVIDRLEHLPSTEKCHCSYCMVDLPPRRYRRPGMTRSYPLDAKKEVRPIMSTPLTDFIKTEIARRHGPDVFAVAREHCPALRRTIPLPHANLSAGVVDIVCFERSRFNVEYHYLVADGAVAEDKELVYAVAQLQGLESVYADLRKSSVESWCVVVASLQ